MLMNLRRELFILTGYVGFFLLAYYLPFGRIDLPGPLQEALALVQYYAREHVLFCLIPAFFIAGVIAIFMRQEAVIKYFGARAARWKAYSVASVSGVVLAVCSCTILPLFSSIHKRGAGLGPAVAFLYSGPAINILAIILTARILGFELGMARIIGAVLFAIIIGLLMAFFFRKEERDRAEASLKFPDPEGGRPMWKTAILFFSLVAILIFANWGQPEAATGFWRWIAQNQWVITSVFGIIFAFTLVYIAGISARYVIISLAAVAIAMLIWPDKPVIPFTTGFIALSVITGITPGEPREWLLSTWGFTRQIMPLLFAGVFVAGILLGAPGSEGQGIIPDRWVSSLVGGNSLFSNFFASVFGAFMYFATLTEIPIIQGLLGSGMGKGPALALLLAGPAISLPNMLVIHSVLGTKKTLSFILLVVITATLTGFFYGQVF